MQTIVVILLILIKNLSCEGISFRLATTVDPVFYSLKLQPDLDKGVFSGEVSIKIKVKNVVKSILLHSSGLTIDEVYLDQHKDELQFDLHPKYELMEIRRVNNRSVSPGMHNIFIRFNGSLLDKHRGFYKAMFSDEDGNVSFLAVSDFQPTFARHAFPCFDEPAFKARFQLTLVAPNSTYTALSNMRRIKTFTTSYGVVHKFETSCVMSPYLLAFSVNKYTYGEYIFPNLGGSVPIRVYSLNASNENNAKTLCFAARSLDFYTKYTQFAYPLPKLDFIEYDRSHSGATENWGLVTTKLGILSPKLNLYDETQIANVVAHELAHFWFGNLVTNRWWDDIWLQEGFAVFMALKAEEHLLLNNATLEFAGRSLPDVYQADQSLDLNPIVSNVESPESIRRHFNDITYFKGAAVLRMVELVLGEDVFRQALQMYLKRFQYKTACTNDFINIVESFAPSDVDIRGFLETYLYQNRYPIIEVTEDEKTDAYVLRQVNRDNNKTQSPYKYKWTIPIFYTTDLEEKAVVWFDKDMDNLSIPRKKEKWIKFNYKEIGFYRVIYGQTLWNKFYQHCEGMSAFNRKNLLSEAIQLYRLDIVPCEVPLTFMDFTGKSKVLPLTQMWFFLNQARDEMAGYDEKTFTILWNYIQALMKKAGYKTKFNFNLSNFQIRLLKIIYLIIVILVSSDITKPESVPERVTSCIKWINENLYSKIHNDTILQ